MTGMGIESAPHEVPHEFLTSYVRVWLVSELICCVFALVDVSSFSPRSLPVMRLLALIFVLFYFGDVRYPRFY